MSQTIRVKPLAAAALLAALCAALAACMLMPGKFTSSLDIRRDGTFSFAYTGEINVLALSEMAKSGRKQDEFRPEPCHDEADEGERECTGEELASQRRSWEESNRSASDNRRRERESMKAMLGGLDLEDPEAARDLAARLRAQAGWRRAEYRGNGTFDVDFAITGRLDHDFAYPTIERFPLANAFVQVTLRKDGAVRVDATGFAPGVEGPGIGGLMMGAASMGGARGKDSPPVPQPDGVFTIRTDGAILANNTNDGPAADTTGQRMVWRIDGRTVAAPMALIRLTP